MNKNEYTADYRNSTEEVITTSGPMQHRIAIFPDDPESWSDRIDPVSSTIPVNIYISSKTLYSARMSSPT